MLVAVLEAVFFLEVAVQPFSFRKQPVVLEMWHLVQFIELASFKSTATPRAFLISQSVIETPAFPAQMTASCSTFFTVHCIQIDKVKT